MRDGVQDLHKTRNTLRVGTAGLQHVSISMHNAHASANIRSQRRARLMTWGMVRRKTERIREFSALPFLLSAAVSVLGVVFQPAPQAVTGGPINSGDVAWMLTATGLVLL